MLKILMRNAFKSLLKQMPYSFVNIAGLTIGIASVLILIIWISVETSYDNFHKDSDRLYRVGEYIKTPNREMNSAQINAPGGPEYKRAFPSIENSVRVDATTASVIYNEKTIRLQVFYADSSFFDMFSFDLSEGDKKTCLVSSQGIVLTLKAVHKIFGTENPMGKGVIISGKTFIVTAIAKDPPVNTNMQFECLIPFSVREKEMHVGWDGGLTCYTYLRLVKGTDPAALTRQIVDYMEGAINRKYREYGYSFTPYLQKIGDIHLNSEADYDLGEKGSRSQVFMFSGIGLLILLIACFNFINISTALSFRRAKEISVKKIFGSGRSGIIIFFIFESAIAIVISEIIALLLVKLLLPSAGSLIGKTLTLTVISKGAWLLIFSSLFVFCTIFASFYSSFYLSSLNALTLLNGANRGVRRQYSRNTLVTVQFAISIILIISCIVIYSQMQFVKNTDKGFDDKNILIVNLNSKTSASHEFITGKLSTLPGVISVSVSAGGIAGTGFTSNGYVPEGIEKPVLLEAVYVDENWLKTMGIKLVQGRNFMNERVEGNKAIVNQTFSKLVAWNNPVGKLISRNGKTYEVIGEVKDFNGASLHNKIQPLFISTTNEWGSFENVLIKFAPASRTEILRSVEKIIKEADPTAPFEYDYLENTLASSYAADQKLNILFLVLAIIAIFISSLGLFGLATFSTNSRIKEISIRKINGAMISDIFRKFNFELLKWILVAFILAGPVGYYFMNKWLNNFAFKINIGIGLLILSGLLAMSIGLLTVSWAANKASRTNPAETLRKE